MYVTRLLSLHKRSAEDVQMPPPEGPNSGYLLISNDESQAEAKCWGSCKDSRIRELPFPQNKILTVRYTQHAGYHQFPYDDSVVFIPVMDQPLTSNRYYVIRAVGKEKGQACTCSREEDVERSCFCNVVRDVGPSSPDPTNIYQQVEIIRLRSGRFVAKSVAPDGFPPEFLRRKGWSLHISSSTPHNWDLAEAHGLDASCRHRLPEFNFPISDRQSPITVVGKWYCPFVFIKEETSLKDQVMRSTFYKMALERMWEEIHTCKNDGLQGNIVAVNANVSKKVVKILDEEAMEEFTGNADGIRWFRTVTFGGGGSRVGLNLAIVERMRTEQVSGGWIEGKEGQVKVERVEEFRGGEGRWKSFGCFALVERFALKRMNGSVVITFDFKHTDRIQCKWE